MKGSAVAAAAPRLQARQTAKTKLKANLSKYDQQFFYWGRCINYILCRPNSFLHQRKCEEGGQWVQKYFGEAQALKQINELVDYYRFYKNCPTLAHTNYWNKRKSLYYRRIKRQLQIEEQVSEGSAENHIQQVAGKCSESLWTGTFQLPSQLSPDQMALQTDPDATIRRLLLTMSAKKHKSTREVSKILEFQQKSAKSHLKSHLKTNPSQLVSTSQFKKSKRKQQHKSMSNQPKICQNSKSQDKKLNPIASCQKIGLNQPQFTLNYHRRNKPKQNHKQPNKKRLLNARQMGTNKKKQTTVKKGKSGEKSVSVLCKSKSGRKSKQVQTSANVKAVIDKVKDKIKAQKSVMLKKYIQSRQSCKSNDSTRGDTAKRFHK